MKGRRGCRRGRRHAGQTDRMLGVTLTSPRMGMKDLKEMGGAGGSKKMKERGFLNVHSRS